MPEHQPPPHIEAWMNVTNDRPLSMYQNYFGADFGQRPELILDVGAGMGVAAHQVNSSPDHQATVIVTDITYPYLQPYTNLAVAADALALPFADNTFDRVVSSWLLAHLTPSEAASSLYGMLRVARPLGEVIIHPSHYFRRLGNEEFAHKKRVNSELPLQIIPSLVIPKPEDYPEWSEEEQWLACKSLASHVTLRRDEPYFSRLRRLFAGGLGRK